MAAGGGWGGGAAAAVYVGRDALSDRCTSFNCGNWKGAVARDFRHMF